VVNGAPTEPLVSGDDLRVLERLTLDSLGAVLDGVGGRSGGPQRGGGFEFADYRRYIPGDDVRQIDWNLYERLHELHVRVAPQESRLALSVLIDASASMEFGEPTKLYYARRLGALLGVIALLRSDTVQIHTLADGAAVTGRLYDSRGMIDQLVDELETFPGGRTTDLAASVRRARDEGADAKLAVLISDALVPDQQLRDALHELGRYAQTAALVHVVDPVDADAGPPGSIVLVDGETGERVELDISDDARVAYAERYAQLETSVERACRTAGVQHVVARTAVDALDLLVERASLGATNSLWSRG
jgi:uncharacterized protein (DUF58 family)